MPLYEYRCTACGHRFEKIQSFSAPDEKHCPKCGGEVERLLSAPAIQFKGSGFYLTDYAKSGGSKSRQGGDGGGSESGKSESKADSGASSKNAATGSGNGGSSAPSSGSGSDSSAS